MSESAGGCRAGKPATGGHLSCPAAEYTSPRHCESGITGGAHLLAPWASVTGYPGTLPVAGDLATNARSRTAKVFAKTALTTPRSCHGC
jgi:hypothetical protein